jgi:hypothetical protein
MSYYLGTTLGFILWFGAWCAFGMWGRHKGRQSTETLAWLMGGISVLMAIFAVLSMELHYLGYLR